MTALLLLPLVLLSTLAGVAIAAPANVDKVDKPDKPGKPGKPPKVGKPQKSGKINVAGIRTDLLPSPAKPLVSLRNVFQVGAVDDPRGKDGLALLTA